MLKMHGSMRMWRELCGNTNSLYRCEHFQADKMMESITEWRILAYKPALPGKAPAHCKRTFCGKLSLILTWPIFNDPSPTALLV